MIKIEDDGTLVVDTRHYDKVNRIRLVHKDKPPKTFYRQQIDGCNIITEEEIEYTLDKIIGKH